MMTKDKAARHTITSRPLSGIILCGLMLAGFSTTLRADETPGAAENAERCITLRSIKQTKVLDDQNILFYTTGNKNYKNHLPYPCSGLASADSFMYRTSESKLCNVDIITVMDKLGGSFMQGPSCGLGVFEAVDQQQLDALTKKPSKP